MKTFKKSMAIVLSILMLVSVMAVAGISASAVDYSTYCLIGYINGADLGDAGDWENVPNVFAADGTQTLTFEQTSYVCVKTTDNSCWYMFETYCQDTTGTLKKTSEGTSEKMMVPAGTFTFTLVENEDGTLTLSYAEPEVATPDETTEAPTEATPDETTEAPTEEATEAPTEATPDETTEAPTEATEATETTTEEATDATDATEAPTTVAPTDEPTEAPTTAAPTEAPTLPAEGTFHVVAGDPTLCNGINWKPDSALNLMTLGEDGVYSITYENVPAGTYNFKVTTNGAWDIADFNLTGDAKFGGPNATIEVTEDGSKVTITFKESDMHANAYINDVLVDVGATEPATKPETEPVTEPATTEPATEATTQAPTVCNHSATKTTTTAATYFAKGKTVVTCAACGKVLKTTTIAKKVLKTPTVTVKAAKKSVKVTFKKAVKGATGFVVKYQIKGKKKVYTKTYKSNKKATKVIRKLKSDKKYTVKVRAYVKSGKKIAYSKWTKAKTVKVK